MKTLLLALLGSILIGTSPAPDTIATEALIAPAPVTDTISEDVLLAEIAAQSLLDYQAENDGAIYYFDAAGNSAQTPVAGGFSRKVLGKTADGNPVVQDYYQDSGQPQTSVTLMIQGADLSDFSTDMVTGRTIWYRENGDVFMWIDFDNGQVTSASHFYLNGQLVAQMANDVDGIPGYAADDNGVLIVQFLQDDGKPLMRRYMDDEGGYREIYYRADGSPIADVQYGSDDDSEELRFWDASGEPASDTHTRIQEEVNDILIHYQTLLFTLGQDYEGVFKSGPDNNPFGVSL